MVQLLQDWSKSGIPIILSAKNQTNADHFQQLLEDLGVESTVAGKQQVPKDCPWPKWLESNTVDGLKEKIPILCGNVSSGFRRLDADGHTQFILLTQEEVFGEKNEVDGCSVRKFSRSQEIWMICGRVIMSFI